MREREQEAKHAIETVIKKARIHLYKPIQIAEILYNARIYQEIELLDLETYRTDSRRWRDGVCRKFLGRTSTSSARYQDNLFDENAIPPRILNILGEINAPDGIVEAHIYKSFAEKHFQLDEALKYCIDANADMFSLESFISMFREEPGLRRSIDKIFEIIVYALFETLVVCSEIKVHIYAEDSNGILSEFTDFSEKVLGFTPECHDRIVDAHFHRVGVTNAADRGLDMFANFGSVIQVKHLSLSVELAEDIVDTITANKIVIVCKDADSQVIQSLLTQIGWRGRIQSIVTIEELAEWYERALRGQFRHIVSQPLLQYLAEEIQAEFPSVGDSSFDSFVSERGYDQIRKQGWKSFA